MPKATAHAKCKLFYHFRRYFTRARARARDVLNIGTTMLTQNVTYFYTSSHELHVK